MCPKRPQAQDRSKETETAEYFRRHVLAVGAGTGVTLLAGCSTDTTGSDPDGGGSSPDDTDSEASTAGRFRLLISDQPVAIDDFDELNVSFDRARIFSEDAEETDGTETGSETEEEEPEDVETETEDVETEPEDVETEPEDVETGTENETDPEDGEADGNQRGFRIIDLDDATVDLTQVVGDKAIDVFEGDLEEGRYTKVELYAADVEGIVEGETVDVKIPSGKLQIVKPFEIVAGETVSFVFDINVVKKGRRQEYNLLPVISESGVAGEDVDVEEIDSKDTERTEEAGTPDGTEEAGTPNGTEEAGTPNGTDTADGDE